MIPVMTLETQETTLETILATPATTLAMIPVMLQIALTRETPRPALLFPTAKMLSNSIHSSLSLMPRPLAKKDRTHASTANSRNALVVRLSLSNALQPPSASLSLSSTRRERASLARLNPMLRLESPRLERLAESQAEINHDHDPHIRS